MRALKSSMLSKTIALPRCFNKLALAAAGLMTAPSGAKLPRNTAIPALGCNGSLRERITSVS